VWEEGVGKDRQSPLFMNLSDGAPKRAQRSDSLLQEEAEQVALQGGDLLANDHLDVQPTPACHLLGRLRSINPIVIRDGDQIKPNLFRTGQHLRDRRRPV
jgi:hypothetical protein